MFKTLFFLTTFLMSQAVLACPMCNGTDQSANNQIVTYVIFGFIALTIIPFFFFWRLIRKGKQIDDNI